MGSCSEVGNNPSSAFQPLFMSYFGSIHRTRPLFHQYRLNPAFCCQPFRVNEAKSQCHPFCHQLIPSVALSASISAAAVPSPLATTAQGCITPDGGGCGFPCDVDVCPSCCLGAEDEVGRNLQDSPRCLACPSTVLYPSASVQAPPALGTGWVALVPPLVPPLVPGRGECCSNATWYQVQPPRPRNRGKCCLLRARSWIGSCPPPSTPRFGLLSSSLLGGCPFLGCTRDPNSRVCALYYYLEDGDTLRACPTSPASSVLASVSCSKAGTAGEWAAVGLGAHEVSALPDACHPPTPVWER